MALPPGTFGNGNHPSDFGILLSGVSGWMTPGFQCPCSSIAALPLPSSPAELVAPCWAGVARKPGWNGCMSISCCVYVPAFSQHGSEKLYVTADFCIVALLQSLVAK